MIPEDQKKYENDKYNTLYEAKEGYIDYFTTI